MKEVKSELIRFWSLPEAYIASLPVSILSLVFSILNTDIFNSIISGDLNTDNLDVSLAQKPLSELMLEGYLGPVYQSSVIFIPLALAYLFHLEYTSGDHDTIILNSKSLLLRRVSTFCCYGAWSLFASFSASVVNYIVSYVFLAPVGRENLAILDAALVYSRVALFALVFTTITLSVGVLTRRFFITVFILVTLLFVSLSGTFKSIAPIVHNSLPLIGGKSFAFLNADEGPFSVTHSAGLLVAWIFACGILYFFLTVRKKL